MLKQRLDSIVLDHERRRGIVVGNASWVGGSLKLRLSDSEWELEMADEWIS